MLSFIWEGSCFGFNEWQFIFQKDIQMLFVLIVYAFI